MVQEVNKMNTKWLATQEALRKARAADVSDAAAADEGDVESAECASDKTIEFDPIFPDENTYRGTKEPVGAYDATESVRIISGLFDKM